MLPGGRRGYTRPADSRIGTFAEFIAVPEADVAHKPRNLKMTKAGSLPLVALTAWQALVDVARLQKGQEVFIQAGWPCMVSCSGCASLSSKKADEVLLSALTP